MQTFDDDICFWKNRQFFHRKLAKIAENWDHNIDPRCGFNESPFQPPRFGYFVSLVMIDKFYPIKLETIFFSQC
jgi:hypothetical protein